MSDAIKMIDFSINQRYDYVNSSLISQLFLFTVKTTDWSALTPNSTTQEKFLMV